MNLFVTGASGFIGGAVASRLVEHGHSVTALARSDASADSLEERGLRVHRGDLNEPETFRDAVAASDGVIHVAVGFPGGVTDEDVAALDTMVEALEGRNAPLILTSGLAVYAGVRKPVVDEASPLEDAIPAQVPRVRLEARAIKAADRRIRTIVLRPAHAYGRGQAGKFTIMQLDYAERTGAGAFVGDGSTPYPTVHIDALAAAFVAALNQAPAGSLYNLADHTPTTREVAGAVGYATGGEGRVVLLSEEEARDAWGPLAGALARFSAVSSLRAIAELGWKPQGPSLPYELIHGSLRRRSE